MFSTLYENKITLLSKWGQSKFKDRNNNRKLLQKLPFAWKKSVNDCKHVDQMKVGGNQHETGQTLEMSSVCIAAFSRCRHPIFRSVLSLLPDRAPQCTMDIQLHLAICQKYHEINSCKHFLNPVILKCSLNVSPCQ